MASFTEDNTSQLPALKLLINMGYGYLTQNEVFLLRENRESNVILTSVLRERLEAINLIYLRRKKHKYSSVNIDRAIQQLQEIRLSEGLVSAGNEIYNLLIYGTAVDQSIQGDRKSYTLQYIDWEHPENNKFHITEEFSVTRMGRKDSYRPDIVLFINGIPLVVIECKSPAIKNPIKEAISQHIRNQQENGIRQLYVYSQLLLALSLTEAKYGTTNTKEEFWSVWKEKEEAHLKNLNELINHSLSEKKTAQLFDNHFRSEKDKKAFEGKYKQTVDATVQDTTIYGLLEPKRLLEIINDFILFEGKTIKKVARFQQFFSVQKIIKRIQPIRDGKRKGGVVWHTQGSGKSLTMAMLAQKIRETIKNPQIILVTDRTDLDRQITATLKSVEIEVINAQSGKELVALLQGNGDFVTTTIVNKFQAAINKLGSDALMSPDIFVLIDEAHRTQYGVFNVNMERVMPNACFIVFTGTPLMKSQKNTAQKFGGIIDTYTIDEAVKDKAIRPILYEGRFAVQNINKEAIDRGFDRVAEGLEESQQRELKRKANKGNLLSRTDQTIYETAYDISTHFKDNWGIDKTGQHSGFRGMVVCPNKATAIKYKECFDLIGKVKTEVVMSPPDTREGNEDVYSSKSEKVVQYYELLKSKYGRQIDNAIINQYEYGENIELLIVIDKLLTGFDAPQTIVMYLCRKLKAHTLLQAIARVNRVYPGKDYGYIIDYVGIMEELQEAMEDYTDGDQFDPEDLKGTLTDINQKISELPKTHAQLNRVFKTIRNKKNVDEYVKLLADEAIRDQFYARFNAYARTLKMALSVKEFYERNAPEKIKLYKEDLKKYALIRQSTHNVYMDKLDFSQYEKQLEKLLDQHVVTEDVIRLVEPIDILDTEEFRKEVEKLVGPGAKAEKIAAATTKHINVNMDTDPTLFKKLSELIQETLADMRAKRISELEALKKIKKYSDKAVGNNTNDLPKEIAKNKKLIGVYRLLTEHLELKDEALSITQYFDQVMEVNEKIDWQTNTDIINRIELDFGDYLMDVHDLTMEKADDLTRKCIEISIASR